LALKSAEYRFLVFAIVSSSRQGDTSLTCCPKSGVQLKASPRRRPGSMACAAGSGWYLPPRVDPGLHPSVLT
jgi:hypothetical protein